MNLNAIVEGLTAAVNPRLSCVLSQSTGNTINADYTQTPTYSVSTVNVQVQALTADDLKKLDGLNIQGRQQKIYLNGDWESLERSVQRGGDTLTMPDGSVWLLTKVLEYWPNYWTSAAITLQNGG